MKCFEEGHAAYHQGETTFSQPYRDLDRRTQWVTGWFNAEQDSLFGEVTMRSNNDDVR